MQERQVTLEGRSHQLEPPFMVLATQNPLEQEGTYPLPESELDRFLMKIRVDYPDEASEQRMVRLVTDGRSGSDFNLDTLERVVGAEEVREIQQATAALLVDDAVLAYAVAIVRATRESVSVLQGAGPRASIGLIRAAKGRAILSGNEFVTPDDVKVIAKPVLRHRMQLTADLEIEGTQVEEVIERILQQVEAPRL